MRHAPTVSHVASLTNLTSPAAKGVRLALALTLVAIVGAVVASASSASFRARLFGRLSASGHRSPNSQRLETSPSAVAKNSAVARAPAAPVTDAQLNKARRRHTATLLADGKVLIAGGEDANGFVTEAEIYDPTSATFSVSGNLYTPRADHTATRLADGRVLIAGGRGDLGALNSTEIFDPVSGAFTSGPNLNTARSGQSATVLGDGRIVVAGGEAAGSVEIYDPSAKAFTALGANMLAPRAMHGAALLNDGRILFAGGTAPDGSPVLSGEILDLANEIFTAVGNSTTDAHVGPLLSVLPDGKVQVIGGTDHEDMEIYDPAVNQFGAHAHVFPIGDIHPELLLQIMDAPTRAAMFRPGASTALLNRTGQTITELAGSNQALVAGGVDGTGALLNSASTLNASAATVTTDKLDYQPGMPVLVSGTGWQPNELVTIMFHEDPHVATENPHTFTVQADANGNFVNQQYAPEDQDGGLTYILAATGGSSGRTAQTAFTDSGATDFFRSVASGNWNSTSTWESSSDNTNWFPATLTPNNNADTVTIRSAHTVTVSANVSVDQVAVNAGGRINVSSGVTLTIANGAGTDLDIPGSVEVSGNLAWGSGATAIVESGGILKSSGTTNNNLAGTALRLTIAAGGKYQHNQNGNTVTTATWNSGSTCEIIGITTASSLTGLGQAFHHFTWNATNQTGNFSSSGGLTTVNGNLTVTSTGSGQLRLAASTNPTISVGGNLRLDSGTLVFTNGAGTPTINVAGDVEINGGTLMPASNSGGTAVASTVNNLNLGGNWSNAGSFLVGSGSTVTFNGNNALQTITGSSTNGFANINVDKGTSNSNVLDVQSVITMNAGGLTLTNGTFRLSSASTIAPFASGDTTIGTTKGFWNNGGTVNGSAGSVIMNGLFKQTAGATAIGTTTAHRLELNGNSVNFELSGGSLNLVGRYTEVNVGVGSTVSITGGTMNVSTGGQLNEPNSVFIVPAVSNFSMSGGAIVIQNANLNTAQADLNTADPGAGIIRSITGGTFQIGKGAGTTGNITINTGNINLFNLTINAPSTTPTLNSSVIVNNTLTLTSGNVSTGVNGVDIGSAGSISRTSGHIIGNLQKTFNTGSGQSFIFHVGDATKYTPAAVSDLNVTTAGNVVVTTTSDDSILSAPASNSSGINAAKDVNRSWKVSKAGSPLVVSGYTAAFTYDAGDIDGGANEANFILRKLTSGSWTSPPGGSSVNAGTHTITGTSFTDTSDFAVGEAEHADLEVTNSDSPDPVIAGNNITYTVVFTNAGPDTANSVTVSDLLSLNTTLVSVTTPAGWTRTDLVPNGGTGTLTFTKDTSAADGDSATFTVVAEVNSIVAANIDIQNVASTTSSTADSNTANNTATAHTNTQTSADLEVTKTDSPDPVTVGNNITYTISFTNHGPSDAQNVTVTDAVPANTTFVSSAVTLGSDWSTSNPSVGGTGNVVFSKTSVIAAETATLTVVVKVNGNTTDGTTITNNAVTASATTDPTPGNNTGTATTTALSPGTISFSGAPFSNSETNADHDVTITVQRTGGSDGAVAVHYATSAGSATAGSDYVDTSGDLNWADGDSANKTFTVTLKGDTTFEADETVNLSLSAPTNGAVIGATNPTTLTITNDDSQPTVQFSAASSAGAESVTPVNLEVTLSNPSYQTITVNYAVNGSSTATGGGVDYTLLGTWMLTFSPGETSRNVSFTVNDDALDEFDEMVVVDLSAPANATLGSTATHTYSIEDNDDAPTISIDDVTVAEGNSPSTTTATFHVTLSGPSGKTITAHYATTDDTAVQPGDYTSTSGDLTFLPGQSSKTVEVTVKGDDPDEDNETYYVNLSALVNLSSVGNDAQGVGTITDDDNAPTVQFAAANSAGDESASPVNLAVNLSAASGKTLTVNYAVNGSSTATGGGVDYTLASGMLTFNPGQMSKNVTFTVNDDNLDENDDTVVVDLSTPNNATLGTPATHTHTIQDNDAAPVFTISDATLAEGNSGTTDFIFTVSKTGPTALTATVDYATANGTTNPATGGAACGAGIDYVLQNGTLSFAPADNTMTVTGTVCGDTLSEANETFFVNLSSASNATISDSQGLGTITNDDASAYNFQGFFAPVDNPPIVNTAKASSAIPVKWRLTTAAGAPVSDPNSFVGLFSYAVVCGTTDGLEAPIETTAPGDSSLKYQGDGNWQINWKTLSSYPKGSCRVMELKLNDGTSHYANFKFK